MTGRSAAEIARSVGVRKGSGGSFMVPCPNPAHGRGRGDRAPSLCIRDGDNGGLIMHCHAHCDYQDVRRAAAELGWIGRSENTDRVTRKRDHQAPDTSGSISDLLQRGWRQTVYPYEDANGATVFEKVRLELFDDHRHRVKKTFRYRRHDSHGNVVENLDGISPLPYRLLDIQAHTDTPIWLAEGEKCADAIAATGRIGTSISMWTDDIAAHFHMRDVVIVPDNDAAGTKYAARAEAALRGVAKSIRTAHIPVLDVARADGWDIADYLECGGNINDVEKALVTANRTDGPVWWDQIEIANSSNYLVKGVLHAGDFASIYGESYSGKSHFALDLALAIACGVPWHGSRVRQSGVLYITLEGWRGFAMRAVARRRQFASQTVQLAVWPTSLDLSDQADADLIIAVVQNLAARAPPIGLIVIDTLARALGTNDENTGIGMGYIVSNSARIQKETGACLLWVHHTGKDATKGPRGHSSLFAALDTGIKIMREGDGVSKAVLEKQKDGEGGAAWRFRILPVALGIDQDGDTITAGVPEFIDPPQPTQHRNHPSGQAKAALDILNRLIRETGSPKHGTDGIPDGQRTVDEASWRQECKRLKLSSGDVEAEQKAFRRASEALDRDCHITRAHGQVWPNSAHGHAGQTRTDPGHVRGVHRTDTDIPLKGMSDVRDGDVMIDGYVGDDGHS